MFPILLLFPRSSVSHVWFGLLLLLILPQTGQAQAPVRMPIFQVDLRGQKLTVPRGRFYVAKVLDLRPNLRGIGWVQRGVYNVRVPATMPNGVATNLLGWLRDQLPVQPGARPVVMRIHALRIEEETGAVSEKATASTDLDFLVQQPDSNYYLVLKVPQTETRRGVEVTDFHSSNLAACFDRSLNELNSFDWVQQLSKTQPIPAAQLAYRNGRAPEKYDYPVLLTTTPARGLYPDFLAFRRNLPSTTTAFSIERKLAKNADGVRLPDEIRIHETGDGEHQSIKDGWGFSDGQQVYVRFYNHYYLLHRNGNDFTFAGRAGADPAAVGTASMLGGAVGGLIAAAATSGNWQEYTLDMVTGRISDYAYWDQLSTHDTAMVIVYRRAAKAADAVPLLLDGKEVTKLQGGGDFCEIPWTNKMRELTLATPAPEPTTYAFIPDFTQRTYLELRLSPIDPKRLLLVPTSIKEGEFYVKRMRLKRPVPAD